MGPAAPPCPCYHQVAISVRHLLMECFTLEAARRVLLNTTSNLQSLLTDPGSWKKPIAFDENPTCTKQCENWKAVKTKLLSPPCDVLWSCKVTFKRGFTLKAACEFLNCVETSVHHEVLNQTLKPDMEKYRNKDEFMVYRGVDGNPKTVGFLTGHPKLETTVCVPPTGLVTLKDSHKAVCSHFERFIRSSKHPTCLHFLESSGVWRSLVVRSTQSGELLAAVIIHPHTLQQAEITEIEEQLRHYFFSGPGQEVNLTSLYLQICPHSRCSRDTAPYKLLEGAPFITENCLGSSFRIKPDTFFQANTSAAENLYTMVQEVCELSPLTTVVDIGCGSGSISLLLAGRVRGTLGIEVVESAVEDANDNAKANNITNASFIPGPPEKVLPLLCRELTGCTDVVAVVNPGRGGLHPRVIETIRSTHGLNKLLYLTSKPQGYALSNFVSLTHNKPGTKLARMPQMVPSFAFSIDTLPHTAHFDMGILFVKQELPIRDNIQDFE